MKTLGLIGGMSWHSTIEYYRTINSLIQKKLGGNSSAQIVLHSVNFAEFQKFQKQGDWAEIERQIAEIGQKLESYGVDCVLICANTTHKVSALLESKLKIPLIHIIDVTAEALKSKGITKVGLLGTRFTMTESFYKNRLLEKYNIETIVPEADEVEFIHKVIYEELTVSKIRPESKAGFLEIIASLEKKGAQGVILGCTEIPLLIQQQDCKIPVFDTTFIHSKHAVEFALS